MKTPASILLAFFPVLALAFCPTLFAADPNPEHKVTTGISYIEGDAKQNADAYRGEQCLLDLSVPVGETGFPTVIWFHGGGLTGGKRHIPPFRDKGIAVAAVSYRLSPKGEHPAYLEDAAAATAWVLNHIQEFGGDPKKVFISGHSAGGWLAAMVGMDPRWLEAEGKSNRDLAGIIPVSAQVTTHFHVKRLLGDKEPEYRPIIDEWAPLYYSSGDLPPICLILGDRKIEYKNRVEENELLAVSLRNLGHPMTEFYEMGGLDHGTVVDGSLTIVPKFIKRVLNPGEK